MRRNRDSSKTSYEPPSLYPDHAEVIVDHLAGGIDREVRRDQPGRPFETPFTTIDAPRHATVLNTLLGARRDESLADRAEVHGRVAEANRPRLLKRCLPGQLHRRLERSLSAGDCLDLACDAVRSYGRSHDGAGRLGCGR